MTNYCINKMPMNEGTKLCRDMETTKTNEYEYKITSRKLTISRPFHLNISFPIGCVNRFMNNSQISHMDVAKNILRYFKGTSIHGILFKLGNAQL